MTNRRYSRLTSVENRKNIKNAYFYIFLSLLTIILLVFFGLPLLVKFAGFVGDVAKSDKKVEIKDITPPAPPQFDQITEYTNNDTLEISGKSESGAIVLISANNDPSEVVANSEGVFNFTFNLNKGVNTINAKATDVSNNESTQTKTYSIVYDNEEPELTLSSPTDGSSFYGASARQLTIKGTVSEACDLTINGRFVALKDDLTFSFLNTLSEGENKFAVKAVDSSGNETSTSLTINFSL